MSIENEVTILRNEVKLAREREEAMADRVMALERTLELLKPTMQARLSGENDPDSINARIRRLQSDVGAAEAGGADIEGGGSGTGPDSWADKTLAEKAETLYQAMCSGGTVTAECREDGSGMDGTVTFDIPDCE